MNTIHELRQYAANAKWQSLESHEQWQEEEGYLSRCWENRGRGETSDRTAMLLVATIIAPMGPLGLLSLIGRVVPPMMNPMPIFGALMGTSVSLFALTGTAYIFSSTLDKMGTLSKVYNMERAIENGLPQKMLPAKKRCFQKLVAVKKSLAGRELSNRFGQLCLSTGAIGGAGIATGIFLNVFGIHNPYVSSARVAALGSTVFGLGLMGLHYLAKSSTERKHRQVVELSREFLGKPSFFQRITNAIHDYVFRLLVVPFLKFIFIDPLLRVMNPEE